MSETPTPIQPSGTQSLHGVGKQSPAGAAANKSDSPAFRALLDKLQAQAHRLESKTGSLENPEHLAEAVDIARASLDDAFSLSDRLLEAFREAQHQPEPTDDSKEDPS